VCSNFFQVFNCKVRPENPTARRQAFFLVESVEQGVNLVVGNDPALLGSFQPGFPAIRKCVQPQHSFSGASAEAFVEGFSPGAGVFRNPDAAGCLMLRKIRGAGCD